MVEIDCGLEREVEPVSPGTGAFFPRVFPRGAGGGAGWERARVDPAQDAG